MITYIPRPLKVLLSLEIGYAASIVTNSENEVPSTTRTTENLNAFQNSFFCNKNLYASKFRSTGINPTNPASTDEDELNEIAKRLRKGTIHIMAKIIKKVALSTRNNFLDFEVFIIILPTKIFYNSLP